jgi:hypothetical protein
LFEAYVSSDGVSVLDEHGVGKYAGHAPITVLKRMDDEKIQDEQSGQQNRMVFARSDRALVTLDQVVDGKGRARSGHRLEANGR